MYVSFMFFLTGLFWGRYHGRLISEWSSYQAKVAGLVLCWILTTGAIFLLFTSPLTFLGFGIAVIAGAFGALIGYRSNG